MASTERSSSQNKPANNDQEIMAQKEAIDKEIAEKNPLVGAKVGVDQLQEEFKNDAVYLAKVKALADDYQSLRKTRPDGNCFFRALAFRYFETLVADEAERKRFKDAVVTPSKEQMDKLGFNSFTVEDFRDMFVEQLDRLGEANFATSDLEAMFNDQGVSDYLVVFLRLLASKYLQQNADFFQAFMDGEKTVKEFCNSDVEPMYVESDNIHIIALTNDMGVRVRIMYLDRSGGDAGADKNGGGGAAAKAQPHDFPEEGDKAPAVHLLYRPGHYDILYPKEK